ncbi:MAG: hypothetical protein J4F36_12190 [Nitrosopumilaceae archaeon]|nr:hypothetical protein [Nitrosopumilaceae archaeon]
MGKICNVKNCGNYSHKKGQCIEHYDEHAVCKKLGKPINHFRTDETYVMKCSKCDVSFSTNDKDKLYNGNKCPCCHYMLRLRKGARMKKIENKDKGI